MENNEKNSNQFETLFERVEEYGDVNIKLLKYKMIDISVEMLSASISKLIVIAVLLLFTFLLSVGVALWLGKVLGGVYYGFFIIALVYGIISLTIYLLRKQIKQNIGDSLISNAFND